MKNYYFFFFWNGSNWKLKYGMEGLISKNKKSITPLLHFHNYPFLTSHLIRFTIFWKPPNYTLNISIIQNQPRPSLLLPCQLSCKHQQSSLSPPTILIAIISITIVFTAAAIICLCYNYHRPQDISQWCKG